MEYYHYEEKLETQGKLHNYENKTNFSHHPFQIVSFTKIDKN